MEAAKQAVGKDESPSQILKEHGIIHPGVAGTILGLATDILADPMWIFTPAKVAQILRIPKMLEAARATKPVAALLDHPAVQRMARATLHPDLGRPGSFIEKSEALQTRIRTAAFDAQEFGKRIQRELTADEDAVLRRYIEPPPEFRPKRNPNNLTSARQAVLAEAKKRGLNINKIQALGDEAIQRGLTNDREMLRLGIIDQATFDRWAGEHVRRDYTKHADPATFIKNRALTNPEASALEDEALKARAGFRGRTSPLAERLEFLTKRDDIPADIRKAMGEIPQASYSVAKGEYLAVRSIAVRQFLKDVAETWGKDTAERGFKQIPKEERFGPLAGRWVPDSIASELIPAFGEQKIGAAWLKTAVSWWKVGKILLNPAAHARILLHNLFLADIAGLGTFKVHRYGEALRELSTGGRYFQEAIKSGAFYKESFVEQELFNRLLPSYGGVGEHFHTADQLRKSLEKYLHLSNKVSGAIAKPVEVAERAARFEERLFKLAAFIDQRKAGRSVEEAARFANTILLNYQKVPSFVRALSQYGAVPFISFPFQATQRVARAVWEHPASLGKYGKIFQTAEDLTGATREQITNEKSLFPPWMPGRREGYIRLPWRDAQGRDLFFDAGYLLPVWIPIENFRAAQALLSAPTSSRRARDSMSLLTSSQFTGGIWNALFQGLFLGVDPMTGQSLTERGTKLFSEVPERNAIYARLDWLYRFVTPPTIGTSAEAVYRAIRQAPSSRLSRTPIMRSVPESLLRGGAGIHIERDDPLVQKLKALRDLQQDVLDVKKEIRRIAASPYFQTHPAEREAAMREQFDRIRVIVLQIGDTGRMQIPERGVHDYRDVPAEPTEAPSPAAPTSQVPDESELSATDTNP